MQPTKLIKEITTERINELIDERTDIIYGLQQEINDLTDELETRQNPDRPIQLELF
jgi:hypothetical protein